MKQRFWFLCFDVLKWFMRRAALMATFCLERAVGKSPQLDALKSDYREIE